jgi:hypothetical protein
VHAYPVKNFEKCTNGALYWVTLMLREKIKLMFKIRVVKIPCQTSISPNKPNKRENKTKNFPVKKK